MRDEAIKVLKELADSESFIVHDTSENNFSLDIDEERTAISKEIFDYMVEHKAIKKLADSDAEMYYIISSDGKNMIFDV